MLLDMKLPEKIFTALVLPVLLTSCGTYASGKAVYNTADCDYLEWHGGAAPSLIMRGVRSGAATRAAGSLIGTATAGAGGILAARVTGGLVR